MSASTDVWTRTGTAPISWGVCEVPGWGIQLPVDRVLSEMAELGFTATELGSAGYLPTDPAALRATLDEHGLSLSGGFVALALHDAERVEDTIAQATGAAELLAAGGARHFVTCAVSDPDDWTRPELSDDEWAHLLTMIDRVGEICAAHGLNQVFHVHVDSLVETAPEIQRVVDASEVAFVLETGHMAIGGFDPLAFATEHPDRVGLVHLKDIRYAIAQRLNADELSLMEAVQAGLFTPLGEGDVPIDTIIRTLEAAGYRGEYVIEQDAAITAGEPAAGDGPIRDVQTSVAYIRSIDADLGAARG